MPVDVLKLNEETLCPNCVMSFMCFIFWCISLQRLAIELFRRQKSRSSSPPDRRLCPTTSSGRDSRQGKSFVLEDGSKAASAETKEDDDEEKTQHDDSNVRPVRAAFMVTFIAII